MKKFLPNIIIAIIFLIIGFGAGFEYQSYRIRSAIQQAFTNPSAANSDSSPTPATIMQRAKDEGMTVVEKKIGDEVVFAVAKLTATSVDEKQTLSNGYGNPSVAKQGTKFVVVGLTVTNTTSSSFTFSPDDAIMLVDNKNREYKSYSDSYFAIDNYLNGRTLSPSVSETGFLVYEIPSDAIGYSVVGSRAGTKQLYKIILK